MLSALAFKFSFRRYVTAAIDRKRLATAAQGGDDVRDGGGMAAVAPAARDDAVQLLAALVSAAGDELSSAAPFPFALARAVAFAAVEWCRLNR